MRPMDITRDIFGEKKIKENKDGEAVRIINGFEFVVTMNADLKNSIIVWISMDDISLGFRTFPRNATKRHIINFCEKFGLDPEYRKSTLFGKNDFTANPKIDPNDYKFLIKK